MKARSGLARAIAESTASHGDTVDHFDSTNGLSNDYVIGLSEDREGTLWVTTGKGSIAFPATPVVGHSAAEGLCSQEAVSILAARDGSVWIGGDGALGHLRDGTVSCLRAGHGLPGSQVTSLLEDHAGRLWVGVDQTLFVYHQGVFRQVPASRSARLAWSPESPRTRTTTLDCRQRAAPNL